MIVAFQNIPATEGVRKIARGEGEPFDVAGAHLTWKVKGEDSGYAFSVCEQTLAPGEGVPLQSHSSPEVFYVLEGQADFFRIVAGKEDWIRCEAGSTMILPPNSLHAFYKRSSESCRALGISTQLHQTFFDAVASANQHERFSALPLPEAMAGVVKSVSGTICTSHLTTRTQPLSSDSARRSDEVGTCELRVTPPSASRFKSGRMNLKVRLVRIH